MGTEIPGTPVVVAVTRPRHQAPSLAAALEGEGLSAVVVPLIETVPVRDGVAALDRALRRRPLPSWVVITSANAAGSFLAALARTGLDPAALRVAAVGWATAGALDAGGVTVELVPPEHTAGSLVAALGSPASGSNRRVLLPVSAIAPSGPIEQLSRAGWEPERMDVYRTEARPLGPGDLSALSGAAVVTLTSGSAVRAYVTAMGVNQDHLIASIGPSTTAVARDLGLEVDVEADPHTSAGLAMAVSRLVRGGAGDAFRGQ